MSGDDSTHDMTPAPALLEAIYEAAGDESQWSVALAQVADWIGTFAGMYYLFDKNDPNGKIEAVHYHGYSVGAELSYLGYYNSIDPHVPLVVQTPMQTWFQSNEHFDQNFFDHDRCFQEFFIPHDTKWITGTRLWETDQCLAVMAFQRHLDDAPFGGTERARLAALTSHLSRATQLHKRLMASRFEAQLGMAAIHALNFGMAMVDADGVVLLSNTVAEGYFGGGGSLQDAAG